MKVHSHQIVAYIEYLKQTGLTITLHGGAVRTGVLLRYNYHQNPYCHYVKTVYGRWGECICRQKKVFEACKDGSFFGCCYAGVGEFVYPVSSKASIACFVSVSGFFTHATAEKSAHFAKKNGLDPEEIAALTQKHLDPQIPPKPAVDAVIQPLIFMLEAYFDQSKEAEKEEVQLYHRVLKYVTENCHSRLTMKELGEHFNYSVSTLSHLFLKNSGKSLPAYLEELRTMEAEWYLANSKTGITEIAVFLGYGSGNYFSTVFKKSHGMTPREYRNRHQARPADRDG